MHPRPALLAGGGQSTAVAARPPVSLTSLIGRQREIHDLQSLVSSQRLVTLTGVGGSGKTRLAAELALRLDWQRADSVAWIELAACSDPLLLPQHAAAALSLRATCGGSATDALVEALRERDPVLVLDDCEHLIGACAELARTLLVRCPTLRILATSREPLGIAGERVWPVPPISGEEAVQLFADRAAAVDPRFVIGDDNAAAVAEICRRLDAIPLAIELAAARVRVLTPTQIAEKLEDRFALLTSASRTTLPRHRTLRAAIDWSFALLSPKEQTLLARLSVFAGSFSLEMAETLCGADLDLLTGLVDKSLVGTKRRLTTVRYQLLDTIRQYAAERLENAGETAEYRRRHALAFLTMARVSVVDANGVVLSRLEALDAEHDNFRAALSWSIDHAADEIALPLVAAFRWYWYYRILWSEGLRWSARVLERSSPAASRDRAATLAGAGTFATYTGDLSAALRWLEEAEEMWRALGDDRELALSLSPLAQTLTVSDLDAADRRAAESVALARAHGTPWDLAYCLTNAAACVANNRGEYDQADRVLEEASSIVSHSNPLGLTLVLNARAMLATRRGDLAAAARFARTALVEARPLREVWFCARSLRILAAASTSDLTRAARLLGAAGSMLRGIGARLLVHERAEHERLMTSLRDTLTPEVLESRLAEGGAMSFDEACDLALRAEITECSVDAPLLHVSDLGPLEITLGGSALAVEGRASNRARELLVFLLAHSSGPTKEEVGVAFWPDATSDQVKNSFHVTLHRLRRLLGGPETIVADAARYRVALPWRLDSRSFETAMTAALRAIPPDVASLEAALAMYQGDFLQGEDAGEWSLPIRSRLRQLYLRGLFAHGEACEARGRFTDAAESYTRVLAREPFHEAAARQLMICHSRLGSRSESLLIYRELEQRLRSDLQATPEPETATLYRRLRQNESV